MAMNTRLNLSGVAALVFVLVLGMSAPALLNADWQVSGFAGDGHPGVRNGERLAARFNWPTDVVVAPDWSVYVADFGNHLVRHISPQGVVSVLAGSGAPGYGDGVGTQAQFHGPNGLALGPDGALYVADAGNARIRKIILSGDEAGRVTTVAGDGVRGVKDGLGASARFVYPTGIAFDLAGLLYVVDRWANMVRVITPEGVVGHLAGDGRPGRIDGPGRGARFDNPLGAAWVPELGLVVADAGNDALRLIAPNGQVSHLLEGVLIGEAVQPLGSPGLAWDSAVIGDGRGGVYVSDANHHRIRHVDRNLTLSTVAGRGVAGTEDGSALAAGFVFVTGLALDPAGNLLVADAGANRIRRVARNGTRVVALKMPQAWAGR